MTKTIEVKTKTEFKNDSNFKPKQIEAWAGEKIEFEAARGSSTSFQLVTDPEKAFRGGKSPYPITGSGTFVIRPKMKGKTITLSVMLSETGDPPPTGSNGTINVGGGDPDDLDDPEPDDLDEPDDPA